MEKEYSLDLLGKEYSLEYWKLILRKFGKRIFFRFRYVRFIRNGNFFDKEIDKGKLVIKMFLIKHKLKISNFIKNNIGNKIVLLILKIYL